MPPATKEELAALEPYIAGARPDEKGETEMYCPMHPDTKRSASVNVAKGVWYCHAGCGGSSVRQLVGAADSWVSAEGRVQYSRSSATTNGNGLVLPTTSEVEHWHRRLRRDRPARKSLQDERGLYPETLRRAMIGYDGKTYKIPVFGPHRRLWNVRNYDPHPINGRSKIWNTRGMGDARIYPFSVLERAKLGDDVFFLEGEWDSLLSLQHGQRAVTRTDGAGKPWNEDWTEHFAGLRVFTCHDADNAGHKSDLIVREALCDVAEVHQCFLPFRQKRSGGRDMSDYLLMFQEDRRNQMLVDLIMSANRVE